MLVVYDSLTGLGKKYADSLGYKTCDIRSILHNLGLVQNDDGTWVDVKNKENFKIQLLPEEEEIFLVTRCFNFGEVPEATLYFLDYYHDQVIGTATGGNRNWGRNYAIAGEKIEQIYGIPSIVKFEASGFPHERKQAKDFIDFHNKTVAVN